ncbi:MAG TPA: ATP-binding cassette domain-containing protein [Sphingobium sp.]|nr:ATP-binding cassette domain-containing protein [Sphingobium sp.]
MTDAAPSAPPIRVSGLRNVFDDHVVHDGLELEMRQGEILGVVGGSGTGKSVLLNTILGLKRPDRGRIEIFGRNIHDSSSKVDVKQRIGVMFQGAALFSALTVGQNVEAPIHEHTVLPDDFVRKLALLKIELVGLAAEVVDQLPSVLSGGMRKRAGVARALALDPDLLLLDEPTAGLDPISASEIDTLIRGLCDSHGLSVLIITHDLDTLHAITDRVAVLADGKVVATAPIDALKNADHPWIKSYFNGARGRAAANAHSLGTRIG